MDRHGSHIDLTLILFRLARVNGPWLREELGVSVLIKMGSAAKMLSQQLHNSCHLVLFALKIISYTLKVYSIHNNL